MSTSTERGSLIVFEGIDRCGKTTQTKRLVEELKKEGKNVKLLHFPDRDTAIGNVINGYLEKTIEIEDDHAVHLLFSANHWEAVPQIRDDLMKGTTLIVDRYAYSGVAYRVGEPGMDLDWCKQTLLGMPKPDRVLYLNLSPEDADKRHTKEQKREKYEELAIQKRTADNFKIWENEGNWKVIDASKSKDEVYNTIKGIVEEIMNKPKQELDTLWN